MLGRARDESETSVRDEPQFPFRSPSVPLPFSFRYAGKVDDSENHVICFHVAVTSEYFYKVIYMDRQSVHLWKKVHIYGPSVSPFLEESPYIYIYVYMWTVSQSISGRSPYIWTVSQSIPVRIAYRGGTGRRGAAAAIIGLSILLYAQGGTANNPKKD